jgi:hypothetical protein
MTGHRKPINDKGLNFMEIKTEGADLKPSTPIIELPTSIQLRRAVFGGSHL